MNPLRGEGQHPGQHLVEPDHVGHCGSAGRLSVEHLRRAQRPAGEQVPAPGAVGERSRCGRVEKGAPRAEGAPTRPPAARARLCRCRRIGVARLIRRKFSLSFAQERTGTTYGTTKLDGVGK